MPRQRTTKSRPSRLHKPRGPAVVTLNGRDHLPPLRKPSNTDSAARSDTAVAPRRDGARRLKLRPLRLDRVVEQAVVARVDEAVEVEVAVGVPAGALDADEVVEDAEVAGVDLPVEVGVGRIRVHDQDVT